MAVTPYATFGGQVLTPWFPGPEAMTTPVGLVPSQTLARGTLLGMVTATKLFKAYASGNSDGSQTAKLVLMYDCTVDASGNITMQGERGQTAKVAPAFYKGSFRTTDLVGLDANALTGLNGRIITGTLADGVLHFG